MPLSNDGDTILHLLCNSKRWEEKERASDLEDLISFFLERNLVNVNQRNYFLQTPFHLACSLRVSTAAEKLQKTQVHFS
jgi:hypothetical protein